MADDILLNGPIKGAKNNNKRMSTLLFWQGRGKGSPGSPAGRNWIHQPDLLVKGHVAYLVKFLGSTQVEQPKGIEVVKDAIKKLNFNQQLKAKENAKCKKVEITVSVDGVAIQEPRTSNILHQFPLHRISYCADDKGAKKYFSFIAKSQPTTNGVSNGESHSEKEQHECFVFVSTKLAAEITLTIGQAFDLAYRRFLNDNNKYIDLQKLTLQNKKLELQVNAYKTRLLDLARLTYKDDLQGYLSRSGLGEVIEFKTPPELSRQISALNIADANSSDPGLDLSSSLNSSDTHESNNLLLDATPPRHEGNHISVMSEMSASKNPVVGTKLEGLLLNSDSDSDFDPRASESEPPAARVTPRFGEAPRADTYADVIPPPLLAPPPKTSKRQNAPATGNPITQNGVNDLFGSSPFSISSPQPNQTNNGQIQASNGQVHASNGQVQASNGQVQASNGQVQASNGQILQQNIQNLQSSPFNGSSVTPNYDISDFSVTSSVFNTSNTSFTNGLAGYDPFETQKFNGNNIFGNSFGSPAGFNGFGGLSEKQTVPLDSSFNGFLDKRINEMKDGFSRGITFGNDDFNLDHLDPLKKN